jgi:hypothetical protein
MRKSKAKVQRNFQETHPFFRENDGQGKEGGGQTKSSTHTTRLIEAARRHCHHFERNKSKKEA